MIYLNKSLLQKKIICRNYTPMGHEIYKLKRRILPYHNYDLGLLA